MGVVSILESTVGRSVPAEIRVENVAWFLRIVDPFEIESKVVASRDLHELAWNG
jgi:hypothetical protein